MSYEPEAPRPRTLSRRIRSRVTDIVVIASLVFVAVYAALAAYIGHLDPQLARAVAPAAFTDPSGEVIYTAQPGDTIVMRQEVERRDTGCFADYFYTLTGKVHHQFPPVRSHRVFVAGQRSIIFTAKTLLALPQDLPAGYYQLRVMVYPTCSGIQMPPYVLSFEEQILTLTVEPKTP